MVKILVDAKNFNLAEGWDTVDIDSGLATGSITETLVVRKNTLVQACFALVTQEAVSATGTAVFEVGDSNDSDGLMLSQDLKVTKEQLYGNDPDHIGEYLKAIRPYDNDYSELTPVTPHDQLLGKFYFEETTLQVKTTVATAVLTATGKVRVWFKLLRLIT